MMGSNPTSEGRGRPWRGLVAREVYLFRGRAFGLLPATLLLRGRRGGRAAVGLAHPAAAVVVALVAGAAWRTLEAVWAVALVVAEQRAAVRAAPIIGREARVAEVTAARGAAPTWLDVVAGVPPRVLDALAARRPAGVVPWAALEGALR